MFAILGAAGNVGYAASKALCKAGMPVRAILHDESKTSRLRELGCQTTTADLYDPVDLAKAFEKADFVQIVLLAAPHVADTSRYMRSGILSLHEALATAKPRVILAISDYGAHVPYDIGMPSIFHELEAKLSLLEGHKIFLRSAEHMEGWGRAIPKAIETAKLQSFDASPDALQPTVTASDFGVIAVELLLRPSTATSVNSVETVHAEGPQRYSANDLAAIIGKLGGTPLAVERVPRSQWEGILEEVMSPSLADLLIKASDAKNEGGLVDVEPGCEPVMRGSTTLIDALRPALTGE